MSKTITFTDKEFHLIVALLRSHNELGPDETGDSAMEKFRIAQARDRRPVAEAKVSYEYTVKLYCDQACADYLRTRTGKAVGGHALYVERVAVPDDLVWNPVQIVFRATHSDAGRSVRERLTLQPWFIHNGGRSDLKSLFEVG